MPAANFRCNLSAALPFFILHTLAPFFVGWGLFLRAVEDEEVPALPAFLIAPWAIFASLGAVFCGLGFLWKRGGGGSLVVGLSWTVVPREPCSFVFARNDEVQG